MSARECLSLSECCQTYGPCPLGALDKEKLQELEPWVGMIHRPAGSVVFEEGDSALDVYLICQGEVEMVKSLEHGGRQVLFTRRQGDLLGSEEVITKEPVYRETARVLVDATLRVIPRSEFLSLLGQSPHFDLEVLQRLASRLLHLEQKFARFAEKPAAARLVEVLLSFAEHYGRPALKSSPERKLPRAAGADYVEIALPLTNLQLAERVGVTPETLSALLADLKSKEIVRRRGRRFLVRVDRLRRLCRV